jgi:glycosyltransferase involved in cell wall biosynthesis
MKISIVTISFNQKKYLRQCIDSILSQTDCDLEYIVVDPGSTDGSQALIESYGDRIIKVFERDNGPADGLNKGFARATGDILGFINSDDYLLPGALHHIECYFNRKGMDFFVTGHGYVQNINSDRVRLLPQPLTRTNMLHRAAVIFQQGTFFPAKNFNEVGGFNTNNATCWDYELFLMLLLRGLQHEIIADDIAVFRLHAESISGSGRLTEKYLKDLDEIFMRICGRERGIVDKIATQILRANRKIFRFGLT